MMGLLKNNMFPCVYYSKAFTNKQSLANHLTVHTGERPYGCNVCGKTYATRSEVSDVHFRKNGRLMFKKKCRSPRRKNGQLKPNAIMARMKRNLREIRYGPMCQAVPECNETSCNFFVTFERSNVKTFYVFYKVHQHRLLL